MAQAEFAINVFDHDDGAVDDDAEIDRADGEQIGRFSRPMQKDESKKKRQRNGERGNDGGAES